MSRGNLIVGLDVGTTKTCVIVGEVFSVNGAPEHGTLGNTGAAHIEIIGMGSAPSLGIRKGVVVNIEKTAESIRHAVEEAETKTGVEIKALHVGMSGDHIESLSSQGVIAVNEKEIGQREIDSVISAARTIAIPLDREMLHIIPMGFAVDGQNGINDPRGMNGVRLEVHVKIITASATAVRNLVKSCQKAGLDISDIIFAPVSHAEVLVSPEEKDIGVGIMDIGGGLTNVALFHEGNMCYDTVLNVGGNNFTNDIAIGLRMPASEAEKIKRRHGCTLLTMVKPNEEIEIVYSGSRSSKRLPRQHLIEVLQPRAEELFSLVKEKMVESRLHGMMTSGIVLTGGGSLMEGMGAMAENILELPVRIGRAERNRTVTSQIPDILSNPAYATGLGLVLYAAKEIIEDKRMNGRKVLSGVKMRIREWVHAILREK